MYVYLLLCNDGSLYCGYAKDLGARLLKHNSGKGAKYTRSRLPVRLVWFDYYNTRKEAMKVEYFIKRLTREDKWSIIKNEIRLEE